MPLIYQKFVNRGDLRENPFSLYVFGDNIERRGYGGQAAAMRGEPNAVGIPTKKAPSTRESAYFNNSAEDMLLFFDHAIPDVSRIYNHLRHGGTVVWPTDGIGTGRAQLQERAPLIFNWVVEIHNQLALIAQKMEG